MKQKNKEQNRILQNKMEEFFVLGSINEKKFKEKKEKSEQIFKRKF